MNKKVNRYSDGISNTQGRQKGISMKFMTSHLMFNLMEIFQEVFQGENLSTLGEAECRQV